MNKKEFQEKISRTIRMTKKYNDPSCEALMLVYDDSMCTLRYSEIAKLYRKIMNPGVAYDKIWYWGTTKDEVSMRILSIKMFEQVMIENKLYKEL